MPIFLLGLLLGGLSGSGTHYLTGDPQLSSIVAIVATVATWLGLATLIVCDD
ncbi:hypothetical protein [Streptomyces tirandamycinicus]|uniref:hypothetical protein n=1 Tax=Streptomyces tirandamycinicus TaxID=2174846 RepID=UPI00142E2745|nr:hypothetical protein [Streptomyces tirandamycinicus]